MYSICMNKDVSKIEKRILTLYAKGEKRKASNQVLDCINKHKIIFTNKELLKQIVEPYGYTIAHALAFEGVIFDDPEILKLTGQDRFGDYGTFEDENKKQQNKNILGHNGTSVACILASAGKLKTNDTEILKLGSEKKLPSVAHLMAQNGYEFKDKEILKLKDDIDLSVAHEMASKGYKFEDEEILDLESAHGFSVRDFQDNNI